MTYEVTSFAAEVISAAPSCKGDCNLVGPTGKEKKPFSILASSKIDQLKRVLPDGHKQCELSHMDLCVHVHM